MKLATKVGLVLLLVAGTLAVVSSAGFSSVEAPRQANVDVVGDEDAYMGLVYETLTLDELPDRVAIGALEDTVEAEIGQDGISLETNLNNLLTGLTIADVYAVHDNETLVTIQNQFTGTTDNVSVSIDHVETDDGIEVAIDDSIDDTMTPGEQQTVSMDVGCPVLSLGAGGLNLGLGSGTATVAFHATMAGDGFSAQTTEPRTVEVSCEELTNGLGVPISFSGNGNAHLDLPGDENVPVSAWSLNTQSSTITGPDNMTVAPDGNLQNEGGQNAYAAVYVAQLDTTYLHPGLCRDGSDWDIQGSAGDGLPRDGFIDLNDPPGPEIPSCTGGGPGSPGQS